MDSMTPSHIDPVKIANSLRFLADDVESGKVTIRNIAIGIDECISISSDGQMKYAHSVLIDGVRNQSVKKF